MWSEHSLEVVDSVARTGSFSAAAQELYRVPSAISYTVKQLEEWLAVELFERRHRDVVLTEAGKIFIEEGRITLKKMQDLRRRCQQVANGWRGSLRIAVDSIVKQERVRQLVIDFYKNFPDMELFISTEVFNGVWDALADGRADVTIGATSSVPVGGHFAFRDMGVLHWRCVVQPQHPALLLAQPIEHKALKAWSALALEDTSRLLPKRTTWILDNQHRLMVHDWASAIACLKAGLCIGMMPSHLATPLITSGELVELSLATPFPPSPCCVSWKQDLTLSAKDWLLMYLGDSETLNQEWLSE